MLRCVILAALTLSVLGIALAKPTLYMVNDNDKLEPVLVPVSSTVIPLPVYKVSYGVGVFGAKDSKVPKPDEPTKLITIKKKPIV